LLHDLRRDLIHVRSRRRLLFAALFIRFLFRHVSMMAQFLKLGNYEFQGLDSNGPTSYFVSDLTWVNPSSTLAGMEVHFTAEQEARLARIAIREGLDPEELVKDAALKLLEDDTSFRTAVRKGIEQAERGELIEEEEMDARVKRMLQP